MYIYAQVGHGDGNLLHTHTHTHTNTHTHTHTHTHIHTHTHRRVKDMHKLTYIYRWGTDVRESEALFSPVPWQVGKSAQSINNNFFL
jgi:hypothetical protein